MQSDRRKAGNALPERVPVTSPEKGIKMEALKTAMKALGCTGTVKARKFASKYFVELDGKYFGIFDIDRNTFVD